MRAAYARDRVSGLALFAHQAWYVRDAQGGLAAFLLKDAATAWANEHGGTTVDFATAKAGATVAAR